jgi:glycosyltransferase involved in cell wall biosynthesis
MRVLIFHGYLLDGTGSNVYNARLAATLVGLGHEVHLLCQDRHPERQPFVDAVGDWEEGSLQVRALRQEVRCTVYRPDIGGLLPVYVADRYEGIEARTFALCSDREVARYIDANVAAVSELTARVQPQLALANHLVMGPVILARGLEGVPYAVKVHGSALEYTVKPHPERFLELAREGVAKARGILVGSQHTARSLGEALQDPAVAERTRLGPPGVDVHRFHPLSAPAGGREAAAERSVRALAARLRARAPAASAPAELGSDTARGSGAPAASEPAAAEPLSAFARDDLAAAQAVERLAAVSAAGEHNRLVAFVGKLIVSKGVDLLIAAWPLVLERVPEATLAVVGFGAYRAALERLLGALAAGRLDQAIEIARAGRALEDTGNALGDTGAALGGTGAARGDTGAAPQDTDATEAVPLRHLLAFLGTLQGTRRTRYLEAAAALPRRVLFTGRLDHDELVELLPACEALVVPSTFPEAFGMVAAEGAACGALPVSAAHSGLAEVTDVLARVVPPQAAEWLAFSVDDRAVPALAACLEGWLLAPPRLRAQTRAALVEAVREHWSWEGVARGVIAAAHGELDGLARPGDAARSVG